MFTGIVTNTTSVVGQKKANGGLKLTFKKPAGWDDLAIGESVSTDGACLTVADIRANEYDCVLVAETLAKTSFGRQVPAKVNLERALQLGGRLGGHFVQGHVDDIGTVKQLSKTGQLEITYDPAHQNLVIYKGSIAINGVSLTVANVSRASFKVALVPHTLKNTSLGALGSGDCVNLEFDMIGKYIERIVLNDPKR